MGLVILLLFILLLVIGVPLFAVLGIAAALSLTFIGGHDIIIMAQKMYGTTEQPVIFAIPFFILAGAIMTNGGIAQRLVAIARAVVGPIPGGLGVATVMACMFFAAISGSSPVTVVAVGSMMLPALLKEGYSEKFSLGLVTSAGSLGILIPPSIPMIIFAVVAGVSVDKLFLAGVIPGLLIGSLLMGYCVWNARRARRAAGGEDVGKKEPAEPWLPRVLKALKQGVWAMLLPVIILGGIYAGLYTATEASALAVVYAFIVEMFIHRQLKMREVPRIFVEATIVMGTLLIILALASSFNWFLAAEKIPDAIAAQIIRVVDNPWTFLLLVNLLLLATGCVMDIISAILIITPLVAPIAIQLGIDPIHLGVVFIVNLEIGYLTPPIGINLFVASTVFDKSLPLVMRSVLPFLGILLVSLVVVTYIPKLSLLPVEWVHGPMEYKNGAIILPPFMQQEIPTPEVAPDASPTPVPAGAYDWFNAPTPTPSATATPGRGAADWFDKPTPTPVGE